jgi:glycosyltransferase involved in cell wall biosynthesis
MKFINLTKNSVYLEDINRHIPFETEDTEYEIDLENIKKSFSFQNMVVLGAFQVKEYGDSRIEKNLIKMAAQIEDKKKNRTDKEEEPRMESGTSPEVIIKGHIYDASGYGKVNRNLAFGLASLGIKVEIKALNEKRNDLNELEVRALSQFKKKVGKNAISIDSIIPSFSERSHSKYRVLYTTIESSSVPDQTVQVCNSYQEIWVTSDFCKEVLVKHGVNKPIHVFPPGIQTKLYNEDAVPHVFRPALKPFVFCSLFGWSYRKGYDALLKAYLKAFTGDDPVSLLIISRYLYASERSGIIKEEIDKFIKKYGGSNPPHIARCRRVIPEYELPRIYKACNVFVLPSRGEGFGMPICEASLCGLPVISTNYSAPTMFLNGDNSILVDIDHLEKIQKGMMHVHYWDNQMFPSLKTDKFIDNLSGAMRDVYEYQDEAKQRNKNLQKLLIKDYSVSASSLRIKKRIDEIWANIGNNK